MPLAFLALPLYVHLPNVYAREYGMPLATLGLLLLGARLFDALVDPAIGMAVDRIYRASTRAALNAGVVAAVVVAAGFIALFAPPVREPASLLAWAAASLVVTYAGYSLLSVLHQAWAAMHGGGAHLQATLVGWREGMALGGVLLASVLASLVSATAVAAVLAALLAAGCAWWRTAERPPRAIDAHSAPAHSWRVPLGDTRFVRLFAVYVVNGIASAVPATLVLFFVQDRLQAPPAMEAVFLGAYFLAAAAAMPAWLRAVARFGLARTWTAGMLLAIGAFSGAAVLQGGDTGGFLAVCLLSGAALGADLVVPSALLADAIERAGVRGKAEGVYFGWWNFGAKLNLALAAGLALPLLAVAGYQPGSRAEAALAPLVVAYCVLPCLLKLGALALLYLHFLRKES
jgi:glycoside/pentoside/hexuronide:cation symporter, GPH family